MQCCALPHPLPLHPLSSSKPCLTWMRSSPPRNPRCGRVAAPSTYTGQQSTTNLPPFPPSPPPLLLLFLNPPLHNLPPLPLHPTGNIPHPPHLSTLLTSSPRQQRVGEVLLLLCPLPAFPSLPLITFHPCHHHPVARTVTETAMVLFILLAVVAIVAAEASFITPLLFPLSP